MFKAKRLTFACFPFLAVGSLTGLVACQEKYDVKLVVYNWEDYIYEGVDEMGNKEDDSLVERFEKYYKEKTGKTVKVFYETFSTNEDMYQQIKLESISPDLICPSDYMIQKMANDGMLEKFSYSEADDAYGPSLKNWEDYGSPYIRNRFANEKLASGESFLNYAVPYFWGTMGFTYDPDFFSDEYDELVHSWECLWSKDSKLNKAFSLKDSMRDTYVAAIFHVFKDQIAALDETASDYTQQLNDIFNRCDDATIAKVEAALIEAKKSTVYGFEVDEGKDDIVTGKYHANLAWSGDSVYSMDNAEEGGKYLNYALPKEGSNVWFDGWCMLKGANVELSEEFVNFICDPENAALCMDAVGYTSPLAGEAMWDLVNEWYAADDDEEETYTVDLSFYFGDTVEDATIKIPTSERGRQFDAQYPTEEALRKCCVMKDFGAQTTKVDEMWARVKAA